MKPLVDHITGNVSMASAALAKHGFEAVRSGSVETLRLVRVAFALISAGADPQSSLLQQLALQVNEARLADGGWADPEETAFATSAISRVLGKRKNLLAASARWLNKERRTQGGWGRHPRDPVRIITTALVITLVPQVAIDADWKWLRDEWRHDLEREVKLSYKGGFYLLAEKRNAETTLPDATIRFLEQEQNDDGGFGPWKDHPIGSDPWSTGVVLWGLSRWIDRVDKSVVERALAWLEKTQLPSGYWPYHYLDEGTSYALIGAVSALKALQRL
jgi:hypothetical protein